MTITSWNTRKQLLSRTVAVITIAMFAFVALVGLHAGMNTMDEAGRMENCPFLMYKDTLCQMTVSEHIEHWQMVVTGIIPYLGLLGAFFVFFFVLPSRFGLSSRQKWRHILRFKYLFCLPWHTYLSQAFSDGILHPKLFA